MNSTRYPPNPRMRALPRRRLPGNLRFAGAGFGPAEPASPRWFAGRDAAGEQAGNGASGPVRCESENRGLALTAHDGTASAEHRGHSRRNRCRFRYNLFPTLGLELRTRRAARARRALSLLEVILAIAILAGCIAAIGQLIHLGSREAEEARDMTRAQLLCESKIEEIAAGVTPAEAASAVPFENDPGWMYSVAVNPLDRENLIEVRVTVQQAQSTYLQPLSVTFVRWMLDPGIQTVEETTEPAAEEPADAPAGGEAAPSAADALSPGATETQGR